MNVKLVLIEENTKKIILSIDNRKYLLNEIDSNEFESLQGQSFSNVIIEKGLIGVLRFRDTTVPPPSVYIETENGSYDLIESNITSTTLEIEKKRKTWTMLHSLEIDDGSTILLTNYTIQGSNILFNKVNLEKIQY